MTPSRPRILALPLLALLVAAAALTAAVTSEAADTHRYEIESAIVVYQFSGMEKGTETLSFDGYGAREVREKHRERTVGGRTQKTNSLSILEGEVLTSINLDTHTGTRAKRSIVSTLSAEPESPTGSGVATPLGSTKIGTKEIAGKTCDVWENASGRARTCLWKGLTLESESGSGSLSASSIATSVKEGVKLSPSLFALPAGVRVADTIDAAKHSDRLPKPAAPKP